ncbi:hypothetical protein Rm378p093 [Rhodothermus phage RM378]|uniref:hypothetical protein n=1 Tax=Rhodothermus phage RM378 TaxID=148943 RepID=UPI000018F65D|nr:hypothetical protein Rm378p093 [Rhodothermus phage RM378]
MKYEIIKIIEKLIDYETPYYFVMRFSRDIITDLKTGFTSVEAYPSLRKLIRDETGWMYVDAFLEERGKNIMRRDLLYMDENKLEAFLEDLGVIPAVVRERANGWWGLYHYDGLACWHLESYVVGDAIFEYCKRLETHNLIERKFYTDEVLRIIDLSPLDGVLYKCDLKDTYLIEVKDTHFDPAM